MNPVAAALSYFGLVFGAGFVLGTCRTLWLVPHLGERNAELLETPLMVLATFAAARFVVGRTREPRAARRLGVGLLALLLLVAAELGVVWLVRRESLATYVAGRDPVSGTVYLLALAVFAAAPCLVRRGNRTSTSDPDGSSR